MLTQMKSGMRLLAAVGVLAVSLSQVAGAARASDDPPSIPPIRQAKVKTIVSRMSVTWNNGVPNFKNETLCTVDGNAPVYDTRGLSKWLVKGEEFAACSSKMLNGTPVRIRVSGMVHLVDQSQFGSLPVKNFSVSTYLSEENSPSGPNFPFDSDNQMVSIEDLSLRNIILSSNLRIGKESQSTPYANEEYFSAAVRFDDSEQGN